MITRRTLLGALATFPMLGTTVRAADGPPSTTDLNTRIIPGADTAVPVIGIGTAERYEDPDDDELPPLKATIKRFVELGGKLIDTAPSYGRAEEILGQMIEELGVRDRLFLATKVSAGMFRTSRSVIDQSFRNLRTDVIDLVQLHSLSDVANELAMLRDFKAQGKVRSIGASVSSAVGFSRSIDADEATASAEHYANLETAMRRERLDVIQIDYSIDNRGAAERILPLAQEQGLAVLTNLPFGRGRILRATQGRPLPDWAAEIGAKSWPQVVLKYIVSHPARPIAIPGTAQVRYVEDNVAAARGPLPDAAMRQRMEQFVDSL